MFNRSAIRLYVFVAALLGTAAPVLAQFTPATVSDEPASGERYHIEGSAGLWHPGATMSISSESLGIPGDTIDFKKDLGLKNQTFKELHLVLRPWKRSKFRFQYIPIEYQQSATVTREFVFNGQRYPLSAQVESDLNWKAYRFTYEYDFISRDRGFGGFLLEAKYTDVKARIASPSFASPSVDEFADARAPIPAIGGIVRVYVVPIVSVTAELSGIKIPDSISKKYKAHYADFDMYGTVNLTENFGAQLGYRSFDVGYLIKEDSGSFVLKGLYFGVVARY